MADVQLVNVQKVYPGVKALAVNNVNLNIEDGEFLVLLGPSGCGKTTTLRMIAGLEDITGGEIKIGGRRVNELEPGDRDIAFVFQFYALYPHLSVRDNITFPLRAQRVPAKEVQERLNTVAKLLQIEHILDRRPGRLPSGEQQRVALGRAMIRRPQVFLMDEPLTNLDASLRADMRVELKHLQQELGTTMVYVTHDQVEAMTMSHRIAVMNLGVLQQVATPLDIYNMPQTLFVASFIGTPPMSLIPCRVEGECIIGLETNFRLVLQGALANALQTQTGEVVFGVRAEDVTLDKNLADSDLQGIVLLRELLGDELIYLVDVGGSIIRVRTPVRQQLSEGERVSLRLNHDRLHLFDRATEQRIGGKA
jgi:multiple sugar transport system ATP-binding protein